MTAPREGSCQCGAIRYRLSGDPLSLYVCHCNECQRHTGSAFVLSMIVWRRDIAVLQGEPHAYALTMPDERRKNGRFCPICGTRLWGEPAAFPDVVVLRPGTLDDTNWLEPVAHIWTSSKQPWVVIPPGVLTFETQPDPMRLIEAWQRRARS